MPSLSEILDKQVNKYFAARPQIHRTFEKECLFRAGYLTALKQAKQNTKTPDTAAKDSQAVSEQTFKNPCMPFGKYKDRLIEEIPSSYLEFLLDQDWFHEKFLSLVEQIEAELTYRTDHSAHF